jgi:hypothetical protein
MTIYDFRHPRVRAGNRMLLDTDRQASEYWPSGAIIPFRHPPPPRQARENIDNSDRSVNLKRPEKDQYLGHACNLFPASTAASKHSTVKRTERERRKRLNRHPRPVSLPSERPSVSMVMVN